MSSGVRVLHNDLPRIGGSLEQKVADELNSALGQALGVADAMTPVDTGLLKANKTIEPATPGKQEAVAIWNQDYAIYQEDGTRFIAPKNFAKTGVAAVEGGLIAALSDLGLR